MSNAGKKRKSESPAYALVRLVWEGNGTRSWVGHRCNGLNQVLAEAVMLAVSARLRFAPGDFDALYQGFRGAYWFGRGAEKDCQGERFYAHAAALRHESACRSFEAFAGRKPFRLDTGQCAAIGTDVDWNGERCRLASFREDAVNLVSYKRGNGGHTYRDQVLHRYRVTLAEWKREMASCKKARRPPAQHTLVVERAEVTRERRAKDASDRLNPDAVVVDWLVGGQYVVAYATKGRGATVCVELVHPKQRHQESMPLGDFKERFRVAAPPPKLAQGTPVWGPDGCEYAVSSVWDGARYGAPEIYLQAGPSGKEPPQYGRYTYAALLGAGFRLEKPSKKKGKCG